MCGAPSQVFAVCLLTNKNILQKQVSAEDGRVTYLQLTAAGEQLSREYDADYFRALAPALDGISDADAVCTVRTLEAFYQVMYERRNTLEK